MGQGPRTVLALHCTLGHSGAWGGLADHVGDDLTLVAPDMPNHGSSPDLVERGDLAETAYAAALSCIDAPMDVIGHSFGGLLAMRIAVERPELVRTLTLIEPVMMAVVKVDAPGSFADLLEMEADFTAELEAGRWTEGARIFNRTWGDGRRWVELSDRARAAMARAFRVLPGARGIVYDDTTDLIPRLGQVERPCLLIRGSESPDVIRHAHAGIMQRVRTAREEIIAGAGHMLPVTHPAEAAAAFIRHIRNSA